MVRDNRETVATLFVDQPLAEGDMISLDQCADHIRARRLRAEDSLSLTNGKGVTAHGLLRGNDRAGWRLAIESRQMVSRKPAPRLFAPVADRTRLLWLAEKAAEIGLESWTLVGFARSASVAPRGEGSGFGDKVRARMIAAIEQSRGAWLPTVELDISVEALSNRSEQSRLLLCQGGRAFIPALRGATEDCAIALGPEGGFESAELDRLADSGWTLVSLGSGILRFETAGVAALAIVRAVQHATEE